VTRLAVTGVAGVALLPVLVIAAATSVFQGIGIADPSQDATTDVPPAYLQLYLAAGSAYGIPWQVIAGIGKVECDHGRLPHPACTEHAEENSAGAGGPMQFLASTWAEYGVDANDDGTADRWDPADAIYGAANYLRASGAPTALREAIFAYNHSRQYVDEVLHWASVYETQTAGKVTGAAAKAVSYALAQLGVAYRWGGETPSGFDCSGLAQAAYQTAGIALPRTAQQQFDAGPHIAPDEPLRPGDLVFFGHGTSSVTHVGIVVRPSHMVDAPHPGAVVRVEPFPGRVGDRWGSETYVGATRPAAGTTP
jgi:cell wall-associated NlpC family hydrolase